MVTSKCARCVWMCTRTPTSVKCRAARAGSPPQVITPFLPYRASRRRTSWTPSSTIAQKAASWETGMQNFYSLSEREILALAISLEEEDERVYADYAEGLRQDFSASAAVFDGMRDEESTHRRRLIELYQQKFG